MVSIKDKLSGQDLGPRKDNDFLVEYTPMHERAGVGKIIIDRQGTFRACPTSRLS